MFKNKNVSNTVYTVTKGSRVHRRGKLTIQKLTRDVTITKREITPKGKTRIVWKSCGYRATTVI